MQEFTVGGVLRRATLLLRAHVGLFLMLALLIVAVPQVLLVLLVRNVAPANPGLMGLAGLWYWIGGNVLQTVVVKIGIDDASGREFRIDELIGTAMRFFFPVLVIAVLAGIAISFASVLLIVPGAMLFCRWYLAIPVEVSERPGITASFRRSAALTYGVRWSILGVTLIFGVIGIAVALVAGFVGGLITGSTHILWMSFAGQAIGTASITLIAALANTTAYVGLREIKEGILSEDLVAVFA